MRIRPVVSAAGLQQAAWPGGMSGVPGSPLQRVNMTAVVPADALKCIDIYLRDAATLALVTHLKELLHCQWIVHVACDVAPTLAPPSLQLSSAVHCTRARCKCRRDFRWRGLEDAEKRDAVTRHQAAAAFYCAGCRQRGG